MGRGWIIAVLAAAAGALALALALGERRDEEPSSRRLLPDFEPDGVVAIEIERRGEPMVRLERSDRGALSLVEPSAHPADPAAIADLLGALELLAYQRRGGDARGLDPPRAIVRATAGGDRSWEVAVGAPIEASDQVWLGRGDEVFVAEGHVAGAIAPVAATLRDRRPFREVAAASALAIDAGGRRTHLELGTPPRVELPGGAARADPAAVGALLRELRGLEIGPADGDAPRAAAEGRPKPPLRIRATGGSGEKASLVAIGACAGGDLAVETHIGAGCLSRERADAIAARAGDPRALVDPRLLGDPGARVAKIAIRRGDRRLELRRDEGRFLASGGDEVEPGEVRRVLSAIAKAAGAPREPTGDREPGAEPLAEIHIEREGAPDDAIALYRDAEGLFAVRDGEPLVFSLAEGAGDLVGADLLAFRARSLVGRQPHAIRELSRRRGDRDIERLVRGQLAGEFEVAQPRGAAVFPGAARRATEVIASLRAEAFDADEPAPRHGLSPPRATLEITLDPPPVGSAGPERRRIALGARAPAGCYARVDDGPVAILSADDCEALAAPWTSR